MTSWPQRSPPTGAHLPAPARRPSLCLRPGRRSSCRPDWAPTRTRCCKHCHGPRRQDDLGFPGEGLWPDPVGHRQRSKVTGTVTFDRHCNVEVNFAREVKIGLLDMQWIKRVFCAALCNLQRAAQKRGQHNRTDSEHFGKKDGANIAKSRLLCW